MHSVHNLTIDHFVPISIIAQVNYKCSTKPYKSFSRSTVRKRITAVSETSGNED